MNGSNFAWFKIQRYRMVYNEVFLNPVHQLTNFPSGDGCFRQGDQGRSLRREQLSRDLTEKLPAMQITQKRVSQGRRNVQYKRLEAVWTWHFEISMIIKFTTVPFPILWVTTAMTLGWIFPELLLCTYTEVFPWSFFIPCVSFGNFFSVSNMLGLLSCHLHSSFFLGASQCFRKGMCNGFVIHSPLSRYLGYFQFLGPHIIADIRILGQAPLCMHLGVSLVQKSCCFA